MSVAADEARLQELEERKQWLWDEQRRIREEADERIAVLKQEWIELYDSEELRTLRREKESRAYAAERAAGIQRCNFCGGLKDEPRTKSDDSYSVFTCSAPFHRTDRGCSVMGDK
jgi:hypothetical protein